MFLDYNGKKLQGKITKKKNNLMAASLSHAFMSEWIKTPPASGLFKLTTIIQ